MYGRTAVRPYGPSLSRDAPFEKSHDAVQVIGHHNVHVENKAGAELRRSLPLLLGNLAARG